MSVMEEKPARTRRSFTDEFKRDAVALVRSSPDRTVTEIARELGSARRAAHLGQARSGRVVVRAG